MAGRSIFVLRTALIAALLCTFCGAPALASADVPDPLFADTNGDGVDGDVSAAVFVDAATGVDAPWHGTISAPARTIAYAQTIAGVMALTQVLVAKGSYVEKVTLASGISIYGGYDGPPLWGRSASNVTALTWGGSTGADVMAVDAQGLTLPTTVADVTIVSGNAPAGESSYGVRVVSSPLLRLERCTIRSGTGGTGIPGGTGAAGMAGGSGGPGGNGSCDANTAGGPGGVQGASPIGAYGGQGGKGGDYGANAGAGGQQGWGGTPGGVGGAGGDPGRPGSAGGTGADGTSGLAGTPGGYGGISGLRWLPSVAAGGTPGTPGNGGGGGGGGGGQGCFFCDDGPGNGGGGGGAGGYPGDPGGGGTGGGSSIPVLLINSPGAVISGCTLEAGPGGVGGAGGNGGDGGAGGNGGYGATICTSEVGRGGNGGKGGKGGWGGPGCSGNGGSVWCIYPSGGNPAYSGNVYLMQSAGAPGPPGANGAGASAQGLPGQRGAVYLAGASDWMQASPARARPLSSVEVMVNLVGITDYLVTANGTPLTRISNNVWLGTLTAPASEGPFGVQVQYGANTLSQTVQVQRALGVHGRHVLEVPDALFATYLFRAWGRVLSRTGNSLTISDGGDSVVQVVADSALLSAVWEGCYVKAVGILDGNAVPPLLQASEVVNETPDAPPPNALAELLGAAY